MKRIFLSVFGLNLGLNLFSLFLLPNMVATHFGQGGWPDGWVSKEIHTMLLLGVNLVVFFPLYFSPTLVDRVPPQFLSLPYKKFWLREENRETVKQIMAVFMHEFGIFLFLFLFCVSLLTLQANRSVPVRLNESLFLILFIGFILYTIVWIVRLLVRLRPQRDV